MRNLSSYLITHLITALSRQKRMTKCPTIWKLLTHYISHILGLISKNLFLFLFLNLSSGSPSHSSLPSAFLFTLLLIPAFPPHSPNSPFHSSLPYPPPLYPGTPFPLVPAPITRAVITADRISEDLGERALFSNSCGSRSRTD